MPNTQLPTQTNTHLFSSLLIFCLFLSLSFRYSVRPEIWGRNAHCSPRSPEGGIYPRQKKKGINNLSHSLLFPTREKKGIDESFNKSPGCIRCGLRVTASYICPGKSHAVQLGGGGKRGGGGRSVLILLFSRLSEEGEEKGERIIKIERENSGGAVFLFLSLGKIASLFPIHTL